MRKANRLLKNNLLALRHGHSLFNQKEDEFFQRYPSLSYEQAQDHVQYKKVLFDWHLIDCPLSENGKQQVSGQILQCKLAKQALKDEQFEIVLVSPLYRALQSASIIFQGRASPFKVQVIPELTQTVRYSCDISHGLQQKAYKFNNFDFKAMQEMSKYWYIELLQQQQQQIFFDWQKKSQQKGPSSQQKVLQLLRSKDLYESDDHLKIRFQKLRKTLFNYSLRYKKIAVVSHYYILQTILQREQPTKQSKQFYIQNAKPYWTSLDEL